MSDMLKSFVEKEMARQIKEKYPHIQYPSGMFAKVVQIQQNNEKYICTLKILDRTLNDDENFPEIPNVKTEIALEKGDIAVVLLLYGGSDVMILGRRTNS